MQKLVIFKNNFYMFFKGTSSPTFHLDGDNSERALDGFMYVLYFCHKHHFGVSKYKT